jgi:hypothetical protein
MKKAGDSFLSHDRRCKRTVFVRLLESRRRNSHMTHITVIQHVHIFDGSHVLPDDTVVVQDSTITAVGSNLAPPSLMAQDEPCSLA